MDAKIAQRALGDKFTQALRDTLTLIRHHAGSPTMQEHWKIICDARDAAGNTLFSLEPDGFDQYSLYKLGEELEDRAMRPSSLWIKEDQAFFDAMGTTEETRDLIHTMPSRQTYVFILEAIAGESRVLMTKGHATTNYNYSGTAKLQIKDSTFDFSNPWFQNLWVSESHILGECTRVFLRLTAQPDGSLVDLWDLIDDRPLDKKYAAFLIIREMFAWTCKKAAPPAQYDAATGVFTKTSDTFETIKGLFNEFARWGGSSKVP